MHDFLKRSIKYILGGWSLIALVGTTSFGLDFLFSLVIWSLILIIALAIVIVPARIIIASSRATSSKWVKIFGVFLKLIIGSVFVTVILIRIPDPYYSSNALPIPPIFVWLISLSLLSSLTEFYAFYFKWDFSVLRVLLILITKNLTVYLLSFFVLIGMSYFRSVEDYPVLFVAIGVTLISTIPFTVISLLILLRITKVVSNVSKSFLVFWALFPALFFLFSSVPSLFLFFYTPNLQVPPGVML